jgi:Flp pilus assembly protein TadG
MGRVVERRIPRKRVCDRNGERGQTLIELAFMIPIFLVLIIGVIEVTNAMNAYVTVISTARDGARLGSKGLATDDEIKNLVVVETGRLRNPVDPAGDITVTHDQVDGVNAVRVEVCNDYEPLLDVPLVVPDTLRICSATTMRAFPPTIY